MTNEEKDIILNEIVGNTLDFLRHELTLQLRYKEISLTENLTILTAVIVHLLVNHVVNFYLNIGGDPLEFLYSMRIEDKIKEAILRKEHGVTE